MDLSHTQTFNEDGIVQGFIPQRPWPSRSYATNGPTGIEQVYVYIRTCYHIQA